MKKIGSMLVVLALIINILSIPVSAGDFVEKLYLEYNDTVYKYNSRLVTVVINGKVVQTGDMPAVIIDGKTVVPVREVFESEAVGADVQWNGAKKEIYISYADKFVVLKLDSDKAYVNSQEYTLEVAPMLIQDVTDNASETYPKTMIPLRFVSEVLGFKVDWEQETFTAILTGDNVVATTDEKIVESVTGGTEIQESKDPSLSPHSGNVDDGKNDSEKLSGLSDAGASRPLPTALKYNPVEWSATEDQLKEINESYVDTEIVNEEHETTAIIDIDYDDSNVYKRFIIESDSAMSGVEYHTWQDKFVVRINHSICELPADIVYESNPVVSGIRTSQYEVMEKHGDDVTNIVFDLKDTGNKFELSFSEDREDLIITVMDNSIHNIYLGQNEVGDFLKVTGVASPDVKMFRLSNPDRIVIDFPNTKTVLGFNEALAQGQYVTKIRTAQFDATTSRMVVETDGQADYEITKAQNGETVIQFMEPGYSNIEYANTGNPTISLDQNEIDISIEGIVYEHDYMNHTYNIILSQDYGQLFGDGSLKVNDGIIETINVNKTEEGNTKITIKSTAIYEYRAEEIENKIQIKAYKPKELYDKIVVIDAGHGGDDPGAMANGLIEEELNLTIVQYLKELLDENGTIKVYYTRLTDYRPTLQERCDLANEVEADFFLSVHNNAFNPRETGTETLYFPDHKQGVLTSPILAKIFHDEVVGHTGNYDRGIKQRENLYVLRHTAMPAALAEIGFLTNTNDAAKLKEDRYLRTVAQALYEGVLKTFQAYPTNR